jgi:hypothetical protein
MRNDPFEKERRPCCRANFTGETRQLPALDDLEEPRLFKGHVDEDRDPALCRGGQKLFLGLTIED